MPTLALKTIWKKWKSALKENQDIIDYCQLKYGKNHTIYTGINRKNSPKEANCPYIIIIPGSKSEGEDLAEFMYSISIGWAISNENMTDNELDGLGECDDLGQLILSALNSVSPNHPLSTVEYEINPIEFFPQIVGEMLLELTITPLIGVETIDY